MKAVAVLLIALGLAACSKPRAPDKEQPPEPRAATHAPAAARA